MLVVGREDAELLTLLPPGGGTVRRVASVAQALERSRPGEGLIVLAERYPSPTLELDEGELAAMNAKGLRVVIEYPRRVGALVFGDPGPLGFERGVVVSDFFGDALAPMSILDLHEAWVLPDPKGALGQAHLVAARVAGYRTAVYGVGAPAAPLLAPLAPGVLIATTRLSGWVSARYAPADAWARLWGRLLTWLDPVGRTFAISFRPPVAPSFAREKPVPPGAEGRALVRVTDWLRAHALCSVDGRKGVIEGFESAIDHRGHQLPRAWQRADCLAEAGMAFAWRASRDADPSARALAGALLDRVWSSPEFCHDDPDEATFGLVNWGAGQEVFYGDDNARAMLATLAARRLLCTGRWDAAVMRATLANLRTAGPDGLRRDYLTAADLAPGGEGWRRVAGEPPTSAASFTPHMQAYLWAAYLWAYALSGHRALLFAARRGVAAMMARYPRWNWLNGRTQELARMILPLAFLVRLDDDPRHRRWLVQVTDDLLDQEDASGAIREALGPRELGVYPPPASNEAYGTREASLLQEDGDPLCDLLYTVNFAFLGLHEAVAALGIPRWREAEDRMAAFLCRIQAASSTHPYLDGAWLRGFDLEAWAYGGSGADLGWGPWSVETGWTQTWIAAVLAMRERGESLLVIDGETPWAREMRQLAAAMGVEEPGPS